MRSDDRYGSALAQNRPPVTLANAVVQISDHTDGPRVRRRLRPIAEPARRFVKVAYVSATLLLRSAILALKHDGGDHPNLKPLPEGTLLRLAEQPRESGLVEVLESADNRYTVFFSDLQERSVSASGATR
jgi:hypothetical protein